MGGQGRIPQAQRQRMGAEVIFREYWPALWFVLIVPPQGERRAIAWLDEKGVTEAWYPTETVYVHARVPPYKRIPRIKPIASGYLFVRLHRRPIWDFLFSQSRGKISDVMRIGERPVALADSDLMQMREVPERLQSMREAIEDAKRVRPGDTVRIISGGLNDWLWEVDDVTGGVVRFTAQSGIRVSVDEGKVSKP
jgi:transcription antitermination factor NusG